MTDQQRRVALVTGASRGIGRAIAARLAAPVAQGGQGRHVVLVARSEGPLAELAVEITQAGGSASIQTADLSDRAATAECIDRAIRDNGSLDVLVLNAGITKDNLILRMSDEEWDQVIATNLTSAFVAIRAASRAMMKQRFGRILAIGSTSGQVGNAGQANYAAAKAGLSGLIKSVARELGAKGVTANLLCPGFVETDMTANLPETVTEQIRQMVVTKRLGQPSDIAHAAAMLTADDAGYITGQVLSVDGGMTMC